MTIKLQYVEKMIKICPRCYKEHENPNYQHVIIVLNKKEIITIETKKRKTKGAKNMRTEQGKVGNKGHKNGER